MHAFNEVYFFMSNLSILLKTMRFLDANNLTVISLFAVKPLFTESYHSFKCNMFQLIQRVHVPRNICPQRLILNLVQLFIPRETGF